MCNNSAFIARQWNNLTRLTTIHYIRWWAVDVFSVGGPNAVRKEAKIRACPYVFDKSVVFCSEWTPMTRETGTITVYMQNFTVYHSISMPIDCTQVARQFV
jgi:hypothetical protein